MVDETDAYQSVLLSIGHWQVILQPDSTVYTMNEQALQIRTTA